MAESKPRKPAVDGLFQEEGESIVLIGSRCEDCSSVFFPKELVRCRNPRCGSSNLKEVSLSTRGTLWSYTNACYKPPPPFVAPEPFEPYCLAAVELEAEKIVIMGAVPASIGIDKLKIGMQMELAAGVLYTDEEAEYSIWKWQPAEGSLTAKGLEKMAKEVAILGAGMHQWGKWGRNFVEYGVKAAEDALKDAGLSWQDIQYVAGGDTVRNGYPGYVAGATFAQALGWRGVPVVSCYGACATGAQAIQAARAQILAGFCDVALVVGADTAPKGFFKPQAGKRPDDPDWLRFHLHGITNPTYFALWARRRMELYGATEEDFAGVKVKNARHGLKNPNARYRKAFTVEEVLGSPMVADPLRLFEICATSDGGAALVLSSMEFARKHTTKPVTIAGIGITTPTYPNNQIEMPNLATDSAQGAPVPAVSFRDSIAKAAYEDAGLGPEDMSMAEVYDLSSALELDWYENIGLCPQGEAEKLFRSGATTLGGKVPVNPSGGLACFGEAVPAQAIAQVCELTWQLRGQAEGRQVEGAKAGVTANQGLFGHGSSVVVKR